MTDGASLTAYRGSRNQFRLWRAHLDCRYLERCGPWTDTKIILRTPRALVTGLGAD